MYTHTYRNRCLADLDSLKFILKTIHHVCNIYKCTYTKYMYVFIIYRKFMNYFYVIMLNFCRT